jgi:hypothetical protein
MQFFGNLNKKRKTLFSDSDEGPGKDGNFKKPKLTPAGSNPLSKSDREKICEQRKELPIFSARSR